MSTIQPQGEAIRKAVKWISEERQSGDPAAVAEEFGDLLFAMVNLARHLDLDPEEVLRNNFV